MKVELCGQGPSEQLPAMPSCHSPSGRAGQTTTVSLGLGSFRSAQVADVIASSSMHFLFFFPNLRSTHIFK